MVVVNTTPPTWLPRAAEEEAIHRAAAAVAMATVVVVDMEMVVAVDVEMVVRHPVWCASSLAKRGTP
jgi:hypothetical protein